MKNENLNFSGGGYSPISNLPEEPSFLERIANGFMVSKKRLMAASLGLAIIIFLVWAYTSKTSGEVAVLSLSPLSTNVRAGEDFNLTLNLDTKNNNVVVVKAVIQFDPNDFELRAWDTDGSVFASGNACVYNSKPCEIITGDWASGKIIITEAKPTPGVNTAAGKIAVLDFRARRAFTAVNPNITVHYIAYGDYEDSDVILDDGKGTDILSEVSSTTVSASLPSPANLSATAFSATGVSLKWDASVSDVGITGYKIFRNGTQVDTSMPVTGTTWDDNTVGEGNVPFLKPNTTYSYTILAYDAAGHESVKTSPVSATTLADTTSPSVPSGLYSGAILMDKLGLYWTESTDDVGVTGYRIYQEGNFIGTSPSTSFGVVNLAPDTSYSFSVSAVDAAGNESAHSTSVTATTLTDTEAPTVPGGVTATAVSMTQIDLTWTASDDNVGVAGYNIYRDGSKVGTSVTAGYHDTELAVSTNYSYRISAYDAKGNESAKSSTVSASTNSDMQSPSVPKNLSGTAFSMTGINLTWTASADNIAVVGYKVFRNGTQVETSMPITGTTWQDSSVVDGVPVLSPNTAYSYAILAYDAAGNESAKTSPINVTTLADDQKPTVPTNLVGNAVSTTEISLSWTASTDNVGVTGYRIYRNGTLLKELSVTSYNDTGLTMGTQYFYTVSAYDVDGNESAQSAVAQVTTLTKKYNLSDFTNLVKDWLQTKPSPADVDGNGGVNSKDLGIMMYHWE